MKRQLIAASIAFLIAGSTAAIAGGPKGHGHGEGHPPGKHKGWHKEYRRGGPIEPNQPESRYYVAHRVHPLSAPPPGPRWVRHPDGRYILVAVATGIIADILLHH